MKRTIGNIYEFQGESYRLVDDRTVAERDKHSFLIKMNVWALAAIPIGIGLSAILFRGDVAITFTLWNVLAALAAMGLYVVVHELLHGLTFALGSRHGFRSIRFGLELKQGLAYCISLVPVPVRRARLSLMMPLYVVCLPLYVYAFASGSFGLAVVSVLMAVGSVGDFYYMWLLRGVDKDLFMMEDLPSRSGYEIGFYLYEKN